MVKFLKHLLIKILVEDRILRNVTKSFNYKGKVLISYTVWPFYGKTGGHTNCQELMQIVSIFDELGFCVDVSHFTCGKKINYCDYDVVFGFGKKFEESFYSSGSDIIRIYYATGAHVIHQNIAELERVISFNKKNQSAVVPKRLVPWFWSMSTTMSDYLIVLGNSWTASTYIKYTDKPVFTLNATALMNDEKFKDWTDFNRRKKNYLWFGSSGLIHKGLDLCLEYFANRPDLILHICCQKEDGFDVIVSPFLGKENIIYHGFVDVSTSKFSDITEQCLFGILPSCSEGQSTALLTLMARGLIPVGTKYTGIDIGEYGYLIEDLSVRSIEQTIQKIETVNDEVLKCQSSQSVMAINNQHTTSEFKQKLKIILKNCLHER